MRWIREESDLDRIDSRLAKLAMLEAWAAREGDFDRYLRAIQAQGPWERIRIMVRRLSPIEDPQGLTAEEERDLMRRLEEANRMRNAGEEASGQFQKGQDSALMSGAEYLARHGGAKSDKPS
jgi:hypothetical protein